MDVPFRFEIGKRVGDDLYLHVSAIPSCLDGELLDVAQRAAGSIDSDFLPNVLKLNLRTKKLSWLAYEKFDSNPFPRLLASWTFPIDRVDTANFRSYRNSLNPPILHRKELLVSPNYPHRNSWAELTAAAESLGLFDDTTAIGFLLNWQKTIEAKGYHLLGDRFQPIGNEFTSQLDQNLAHSEIKIQRHLTALSRSNLSAPVQMLIQHGLFKDEFTSIFDYGCGRGDDVETLRRNGFQAHGWDPHFANDHPKFCCDLVNLGFVINVIEDSAERVEALHLAFKLAKRALVFGVMLHPSDLMGVPFQDGVLTTRNTFQKYFTQGEIKAYVEDVLQTEVFMVGPGVGLAFADKLWQQAFESSRYRSGGVARRLRRVASLRAAKPAKARSVEHSSHAQKQVHENKGLLDRLWLESLDLGRFPEREETTSLHLIENAFGTLRRAIRLLVTYCDMSVLEQARRTRVDDLTVYLAIQQFSKRGNEVDPIIETNLTVV